MYIIEDADVSIDGLPFVPDNGNRMDIGRDPVFDRKKMIIGCALLLWALFLALPLPTIGPHFLPGPENTYAAIEHGGVPVTTNVDSRDSLYKPILECQDNITKSAYPLDLVVFNFTLSNGGDIEDDYDVITFGITGWEIIPGPEEFIDVPPYSGPAPESEKVRDLTVAIVVGNVTCARYGDYDINITLRSRNRPSNESTSTIHIRVMHLHDLDIDPPVGRDVLPGDTKSYEFRLENRGNGDDTYDIRIESSNNNWHVELADEGQDRITIEFGGSETVAIMVHIPDFAEAGRSQITTLYARPNSSAEPGDTRSGFVQTSVTKIYNIALRQDESEKVKEGVPGESLRFHFIIENAGNSLDDVIGSRGTFVMSEVPDIPSSWNATIDLSGIREGGLPSEHTVDIILTARIPPVTPVGSYNIKVDIYTGVPLQFQDEVRFSAKVKPEYDSEAQPVEIKRSSPSGRNISFELAVRNTGNLPETYTISVNSPHSSWLHVPVDSLSLDLGDLGLFQLHADIPGSALPGTYEFTAAVRSEERETVIINQTFELEVVETRNFTLDPTEWDLKVIPGTSRLVIVTANNTGNTDIALTFSLTGEQWCRLEKENLFLGLHSSEGILLVFRPPFEIDAGTFEFTLRAAVSGESGAGKECTVRLEMIDPLAEGGYFKVEFDSAGSSLFVNDGSSRVFRDESSYFITGGAKADVYYILDTSLLNLTVRTEMTNRARGGIDTSYTLRVTRVHPSGRSAISMENMLMEKNGEEHGYIIEWPAPAGCPFAHSGYNLVFVRYTDEGSLRMNAQCMSSKSGDNDTISIRLDPVLFTLNVTKRKSDGSHLTVSLRDIPMAPAEVLDVFLDWVKVSGDREDSVQLIFKDGCGNTIRKVSLHPRSKGNRSIEAEPELPFMMVAFIITAIVVVLVISLVVVRINRRRRRDILTKYSVMGYVSLHRDGVSPEDMKRELGVRDSNTGDIKKSIERALDTLTREDRLTKRSMNGREHYYISANTFPISDREQERS